MANILPDPNEFNEVKDYMLNKTVFDIFTTSALGFAVALPISLLFKQKLRFCFIGAGIGAGVSYENNQGSFIKSKIWWKDSHDSNFDQGK